LKFALHGDSDATAEMLAFANQMSQTSIFPRSKILEAETMALGLGRTKDQAKQMTIAAMALSRLDPSMDLAKAMSFLNGTFGGTTKQIERLVPEIKGLTAVQYASGAAIDIIVEKYGRFATEGLDTTKGKMEQFSKSWDVLKINLSNFAVDALGGLLYNFSRLTTSVSEFLEIPVSKKMEDERFEVNQLTSSLINHNLPATARNKIYEKLNEMTPEVIAGIDRENISTKLLVDNLMKYNEQQIKKITLKSKEEELSKAGEEEGKALNKLMLAEEALQNGILKYKSIISGKLKSSDESDLKGIENAYASSKITLEQYFAFVVNLKNKYSKKSKEMTGYENDALDRLSISQVNYNSALTNSTKIAKEVADFRNRLGLTEESADSKKTTLLKSNSDKVIEYKKKGLEALVKLEQEETDVLEKALIKQAEKELKADDKHAKEKEKRIEFEEKLILDAMAEGQQKELAKEDETHRINLVKSKRDKLDLEIEEKRHQAEIEKIKQSFAVKANKFMRSKIGDGSDTDKENERYKQDIKDFNEYTKDKRTLEDVDVAAWEAIVKTHHNNMNKINLSSYNDDYKKLEDANNVSLAAIKMKHTEELMNITTFDAAKKLLRDKYNYTNFKDIKDLDLARKEIIKQQQNEELLLQEKYVKDLISKLQSASNVGNLDGVQLSPQAIQKLQEDITKLMDLYNHLETMKKENGSDKANEKTQSKVDVLGFSQDQWKSLFANLQNSQTRLQAMVQVVDVLKSTWTSFNDYFASAENKKNKELETSNNTEKTDLKKKLDANLISQASYDNQVSALDTNLKEQQDEAAYEQALRQARMNEINALQAAAVASIAVWANPGFPMAIPLEVLIAAQLGASIATIENNIPVKPSGYAGGGFTNGDAIYRAGEDGPEWVASNSLLKDSKTAPVIKWLENYQRGGKTMPMPIEANFGGIQSAINNRYTSTQIGGSVVASDQLSSVLLVAMNEHLKNNLAETKKLNVFLSNPDNRKARLVRDELTKFDNEMNVLQSLAKIG